MRRRNIITTALAAGLALSASFCSFAGEWKQDGTGWFYQNTDGSYLTDGWHWVGGRSYYFNGQGYCLTSTTTPDGYTVDGSGAWIVDGAVQEKATEEVLSSIKVMVPNGYDCVRDDEAGTIELYENKDSSEQGILIMTMQEDDISYVRSVLGDGYLKEISDLAVKGIMSEYSDSMTLVSTSMKTHSTGAWNYYLYQGTVNQNKVSLEFYTHFTDNEIRMVVFLGGPGREFNTTDEFMENCIR